MTDSEREKFRTEMGRQRKVDAEVEARVYRVPIEWIDGIPYARHSIVGLQAVSHYCSFLDPVYDALTIFAQERSLTWLLHLEKASGEKAVARLSFDGREYEGRAFHPAEAICHALLAAVKREAVVA